MEKAVFYCFANVLTFYDIDLKVYIIKQMKKTQGTGKRAHIVADTLLPIQMFPRLPARATFVADTNFVSGTQKMFLALFRNILCPQQCYPVCAAQGTS